MWTGGIAEAHDVKIGELSNESNRARISTLFSITWFTGATIGTRTQFLLTLLSSPNLEAPVIGGALQHPTEHFAIFHGNSFLTMYPYFLPCFTAAAFSGFVSLLAFLALGEVCAKYVLDDFRTLPKPCPLRLPIGPKRGTLFRVMVQRRRRTMAMATHHSLERVAFEQCSPAPSSLPF